MPISKKGMEGKRGDLVVKWDVEFPVMLTDEQKEGLKKVLGWLGGRGERRGRRKEEGWRVKGKRGKGKERLGGDLLLGRCRCSDVV
jgi:DnaJ-class molecular chaperone